MLLSEHEPAAMSHEVTKKEESSPSDGRTYKHWTISGNATHSLSDPLFLLACSSLKGWCQVATKGRGQKTPSQLSCTLLPTSDGSQLPCQQMPGLDSWAPVTGAGSFHRASQCFSHHKWCFLISLFLGMCFLRFCPEVTENLEENPNISVQRNLKQDVFLPWLLPLLSALYYHPVRKVSLLYTHHTVVRTLTL